MQSEAKSIGKPHNAKYTISVLWRFLAAGRGRVACKTTDFKLYYLVKENPLDVITYILIF